MFFQNHYKGRNDWYFYLMTIFLVAFAYVLGQVPMTLLIFFQINKYPELSMDQYREFEQSLDFSLFYLSPNVGFLLALIIFIFAMAALIFAVKFLHKRSWLSLINWQEKIDWGRIFWGFAFWLILAILFESILYFIDPQNYSFRSPSITSFLVLILISLLILPIQTSFEELFFRGYLMQALGAVTKNKFFTLVLTSILFAAVHSMNPEIEEYGLLNMLPYYLLAGLFLGYITIMDKRLELALGVHAATNMFGALFVTYEGAALQTSTLFKTHHIDPLFLSLIYFIIILVFIILTAKKYNWASPLKVFSRWQED